MGEEIWTGGVAGWLPERWQGVLSTQSSHQPDTHAGPPRRELDNGLYTGGSQKHTGADVHCSSAYKPYIGSERVQGSQPKAALTKNTRSSPFGLVAGECGFRDHVSSVGRIFST